MLKVPNSSEEHLPSGRKGRRRVQRKRTVGRQDPRRAATVKGGE
jgi:hypothetical protein